MTTLQKTTTTAPEPRNDVALWSGVAAFFGSLLAIGLFDIIDVDQWAEYLGAIIVAVITAGGVYSQQRLTSAKEEKKAASPYSKK